MPTTLRDIARQSGVSVQTASQILSDSGGPFRAETRERVLKAAQDLDYRPNAAARATRSGRSGSVALLLSSETNNSILPRELLEGIQDALIERHLNLVIARIPDEALQDEDRVPRIVKEWSVDGLLINYNANIPQELTRVISHHHIPAIWINVQHEADCVYPDDERGGREATEKLLELGHKSIAFVDFVISPHFSAVARLKGYEAAMHTADLPVRIIREHPHLNNFLDGNAAFLLDSDSPSAIVAYDSSTLRTLLFLATVHRIAVPEMLSVVGFALNQMEVHSLQADIMQLPEREIGRNAVQMLAKKIIFPDVLLPPCAVHITPSFGATIGPCPAHQHNID